MKIVICDYKTDLARDLTYEKKRLEDALPGVEIEVYEYKDNKAELIDMLSDADAVINTYVTFDRDVLSRCKRLKAIALNAVGYNMVDVDAASEFGVMVCPASEYCTVEVAEHTMTLIFALCRGLRKYIHSIEDHVWDYTVGGNLERISGKTLTVFGFGKIGKAVAHRAQAMGMNVQIVSRSLKPEKAKELALKLVDCDTALATSDIISNHQELNAKTAGFFDLDKFSRCAKHPIFINTGRGGSVIQDDLVTALDEGMICAAGLDVLDSGSPDLSTLKLLGRDNVIITPHVGFYSIQAARDLQDISCHTIICAMKGNYDGISSIVNRAALKL